MKNKQINKSSYFFVLVHITTLLFSNAIYAQDQDMEWLNKSRKIIDQSNGQVPDWLKMKPDNQSKTYKQAKELINKIKKPAFAQQQLDKKIQKSIQDKVVIFVSFSMGIPALEALLLDNAGKDNIHIVVRGIRKGTNMKDYIKEMLAITKAIKEPPNYEINPPLFTKHKITKVPTMVYQPDSAQPVKVSGITNVDWFIDQARDSREQPDTYDTSEVVDLGEYGPVYDIQEPDLIKVMQQKIAKIDWEEKKKKALKRFWKKKTLLELPQAREDRQFSVDLTVVVRRDIRDNKGNVIARRGQRFNPLEMMPITSTIIIFNGNHQKEIDIAKFEGQKIHMLNKNVIYIMTGFNSSKGFDEYQKIEDEIGYPVYLLNRQLASRLQVRHTPSIIRAKSELLWIKEIKPDV